MKRFPVWLFVALFLVGNFGAIYLLEGDPNATGQVKAFIGFAFAFLSAAAYFVLARLWSRLAARPGKVGEPESQRLRPPTTSRLPGEFPQQRLGTGVGEDAR